MYVFSFVLLIPRTKKKESVYFKAPVTLCFFRCGICAKVRTRPKNSRIGFRIQQYTYSWSKLLFMTGSVVMDYIPKVKNKNKHTHRHTSSVLDYCFMSGHSYRQIEKKLLKPFLLENLPFFLLTCQNQRRYRCRDLKFVTFGPFVPQFFHNWTHDETRRKLSGEIHSSFLFFHCDVMLPLWQLL